MITLAPAAVSAWWPFIAGMAMGGFIGAFLGRQSLLLLFRRSWRSQYLERLRRQPVPPARVPHAGYLARPRNVASSAEPPPQFRVR